MKRRTVFLASALEFAVAADADADALPSRFNGTAYTGDRVSKYGGVVIDLATLKAGGQTLPLLHQHDGGSDVGLIEAVENSGAQLTVSGLLFSDVDPQAEALARKSKRGAKYQMSVGVFDTNEEFIPAGKTVSVNGRQFSGPLVVLRDGTLREVSICALGADANTRASFFQPDPPHAMTEAEMQAAVEAANARATAAEAEATQLREAAASAARTARLTEVRALFEAVGKTFSDEAAAPYVDMSAAQFSATAADMRALRPTVPAHLFQRAAVGEPGAAGQDSTGRSVLLARARATHGIKASA